MTCTCLPCSAFRWKEHGQQSVFATDPAFLANRSGKTQSQTCSEVVTRITEATGRSPGSIYHLSAKGNALVEEGNHRRRVNAKGDLRVEQSNRRKAKR